MLRPNATVRLQRLDEFLSPPAITYQVEPDAQPFAFDSLLATTCLEAWFEQYQQGLPNTNQVQPVHLGTMVVVPQQDDVWWLLEGQQMLATALLVLANLTSHPDGLSLQPIVHACLRGGIYGQPAQTKLMLKLPQLHQAFCNGADLWDNRHAYGTLTILPQIQDAIEQILLRCAQAHTPAHVCLQHMAQLLLRQTWVARLELPHIRNSKLFRQQPTPRKYQALMQNRLGQQVAITGASPPPRLQPVHSKTTKAQQQTKGKKPSVWMTRILWGLEWCHRHQAGAVTASQLAQLLSSHSKRVIAGPNMGRAFRLFKQDRNVDPLWEEPLPKRYIITPAGQLLLAKMGGPKDLPMLQPATPPTPAASTQLPVLPSDHEALPSRIPERSKAAASREQTLPSPTI